MKLSPLAAAAGLTIAVAGCGSNSPTAATGPSAAAKQQFVNHALTQAVAYARCMRAHGVPGFADPTVTHSAQGVGIGQGVSAAVGQSPAFGSAQRACARLQPAGAQGPGDQPVSASAHVQMVRFAACMRAHGVPTMPDPGANGVFNLPPAIDTHAPAFTGAVNRCRPDGMPLSIDQGP